MTETTTTSRKKSGGFSSFLENSKTRLLGKIAPGWANSQIDSRLFVPPRADTRAIRLPRGFEESTIRTNDGNVQAYRTGRGPAVVFVHGWGGGAHQFFPLMRGLARIGFSSLAFDHLGHGKSDRKPSPLQQSIATCNHVLNRVSKSDDGLCTVVGHASGCIDIANARPALLKDVPLFLIAPVFNYKLYFLKQMVKTGLPADVVKQYASRFSRMYRGEFQKLELANKLAPYGDVTAIAHDESDAEAAVADSIAFCTKYPLTRLMVTKHTDHFRVINSESVWQELKSHLNYDDTTINFTSEIINSGQ